MQIKKNPDTNKLAKKIDLNTKITEIESKIPSVTGPTWFSINCC